MASVSISASVCTSQPEDGVSLPVWPTFVSTLACSQTIPSCLPGRECMHCGRGLDAIQPLPVAVAEQSRGVYSIRGAYCCSQCAIAAAHDVATSSRGFPEARRLTCSLLTTYFGIPNTPRSLAPAPPREILFRFGGYMTIEQFHETTTAGRVVSVTSLPVAPYVDIMHVRRWLARFENGARRHYAPFERESISPTGEREAVLRAYVSSRPGAAARRRAQRTVEILLSPASSGADVAAAALDVGVYGMRGRPREEVLAACEHACLSRTPLPLRDVSHPQRRLEEAVRTAIGEALDTSSSSAAHTDAVVRRAVRVLLGEEEGWEQRAAMMGVEEEEDGDAIAPLREVVTMDRVSCWARGVRPDNGLVVCGLRRPAEERCVRAWTVETSPDAPAWNGMFEAVVREAQREEESGGADALEDRVMRAAKRKVKAKASKRAASTEQRQSEAATKLVQALGLE